MRRSVVAGIAMLLPRGEDVRDAIVKHGQEGKGDAPIQSTFSKDP